MIPRLLVLASLVLFLGMQDHDQQPAYCINHPGDAAHPQTEPHACTCAKPCDPLEPEDRKCRVWCRPSACHCLAECGS